MESSDKREDTKRGSEIAGPRIQEITSILLTKRVCVIGV